MIPQIEPVLYIDPQRERRTGECPRCGGVCYWPTFSCLRCERRLP